MLGQRWSNPLSLSGPWGSSVPVEPDGPRDILRGVHLAELLGGWANPDLPLHLRGDLGSRAHGGGYMGDSGRWEFRRAGRVHREGAQECLGTGRSSWAGCEEPRGERSRECRDPKRQRSAGMD